MENFSEFVKKLKAGELEAFIKSEPIPENNEGGVTIAVAKNFNEVVLNKEKDVFIEFYAPWCGRFLLVIFLIGICKSAKLCSNVSLFSSIS